MLTFAELLETIFHHSVKGAGDKGGLEDCCQQKDPTSGRGSAILNGYKGHTGKFYNTTSVGKT